jgi:hypothetical protein
MSAAAILLFTVFAVADGAKPGDLVPIDQGVVDQSATATSLRVAPVELSQSTNFQRLFGVAGRPDLLVRSQGGMFAVFEQSSYRNYKGSTVIQWPSGTVYYIGQPDFAALRSTGMRGGVSSANLPPGVQLPSKSAATQDHRIGAAPISTLVRIEPKGGRVISEPASNATPPRVPVKDVGFGHYSAAPAPRPGAGDAAASPPGSAVPPKPDASAAAPAQDAGAATAPPASSTAPHPVDPAAAPSGDPAAVPHAEPSPPPALP